MQQGKNLMSMLLNIRSSKVEATDFTGKEMPRTTTGL
jgi:hypothetical protein